MAWIAEFDRREGWAGPGLLSCAHWLSWRIGLSPGAAREQVRVARRLEELPAIAAAFGEGRMSYSQARAATRVAAPDDGIDWPDLARHTSAAQLEKVVRGMRRVHAADEAAADPELAQWKVRTRKHHDRDGNLVITIITRRRPAPARPRPVAATGRPEAARSARHARRRALPLPRLHPAPEAARPPRRPLERRRQHRPVEPRPGLQPAPHADPPARLPAGPAPRAQAERQHV